MGQVMTVSQAVQHLTQQEVRALIIWKWVYTLRSAGFSPAEVRRLCFAKWAVHAGRLGEGE